MEIRTKSAGPSRQWCVVIAGTLLVLTAGWGGARAADPVVTAPSSGTATPDARPAEPTESVVFRALASALPGTAELAKGKAPDEVVETVLPGRVYMPPLPLEPVASRGEAKRGTPEQASASDFSAFRAADREWLKENFTTADYPSIKRLVEDQGIRKQNQNLFMRHGTKTVVATCMYRDHALVFVQYDGAKAGGLIEVYAKIGDVWKRTNALAKDPTVSVLLPMFRNGSVEQAAH
jgi:hypothetical protein